MPIPPKTLTGASASDAGSSTVTGGLDWNDLGTHLANMNKEPYTWYIYKDGSNYKAKNGSTGVITYTNSNFATLFQTIIDTIPTRDDAVFTKIKIGPGEYIVNTGLTTNNKYNISIEGSGMGITKIKAGPSLTSDLWTFFGSVSGTGKNLTSNGVLKSRSVVMTSGDAGTFAANDIVLLRSNVDFAQIASSAAGGHQGEIKRIQSISSGTVSFWEPLFDDYATADGANVIKLLPSRNIHLSDFTIYPDPTLTTNAFLEFRHQDRLSLNRLELVDCPADFGSNCTLKSCTNVRISDCHIQQNITYNFQYGFSLESACQNIVVSNCTAYGFMRHHFEAAANGLQTNMEGVARNIMFTGCTVIGGGQACFDTHPVGEGIQFVNCGVLGNNWDGGSNGNVEAFKLRSPKCSLIGCYAKNINCPGNDGAGAFVLNDLANDCIINSCIISDTDGNGICIGPGEIIRGAIITNCIIDNSTRNGIFITGTSDSMIITNNSITNSGSDGIECIDTDDCIFSNNRIKNNTGYGIRFQAATCINNIISSNWFGSNTAGNVLNGGQTGNKESNNFGYP